MTRLFLVLLMALAVFGETNAQTQRRLRGEIRMLDESMAPTDAETMGPSTDSPGTDSPGTEGPSTDAPDTEAPSTDAPSTDSPSTDAPSTDAPSTDAPSTDAPSTDTPSTDTPSTDAPTAEMTAGATEFEEVIVTESPTSAPLNREVNNDVLEESEPEPEVVTDGLGDVVSITSELDIKFFNGKGGKYSEQKKLDFIALFTQFAETVFYEDDDTKSVVIQVKVSHLSDVYDEEKNKEIMTFMTDVTTVKGSGYSDKTLAKALSKGDFKKWIHHLMGENFWGINGIDYIATGRGR